MPGTRPLALFGLALLAALPAAAGTVRLEAYGADGRLLDQTALRRVLDPAGASPTSGLRLFAPGGGSAAGGGTLDGRPWWVEGSTTPTLRWEGAPAMAASLPWPLPEDGYSTVFLDDGGSGYADGRVLLVNEEAARWAYAALEATVRERAAWSPPYKPSRRARDMLAAARAAMAAATAVPERARRAKRFDRALEAVSLAWQQVLVEHGRLIAKDRKRARALRWGLSLDESVAARLRDLDAIADAVARSGADWVRVVFTVPKGDFAFERPASFNSYDALVTALTRRRLHVMGSFLDSMLWPSGLEPEACAARARDLAAHFKATIRTWEVASEPNGTWLGGPKPLADEDVLLCVDKAAVAVKEVDPKLETAATLHWWDGTAPDGRHGLYDWLDWALPRGFGAGIDAIGLSVYPHRHPLGLALEPAFRLLRQRFPGKPLYLGGWSFGDPGQAPAYWWLEPKAVDGPRKDLLTLFDAAAPAAAPESVGGGFFWPTLEEMLPQGRQPTSLYQVYRRSLKELKR